MSRDPKARFASARELSDELHAFLDGRVVRSHRTGVLVELRSWARRHRGLAAGVIAGAALVAGAVVAFVAQQRLAAVAIGVQRDAAVEAAHRAEAAQRRSDGLRLAAQSSGVLTRDPGLALAMSVEALALAPGPEARSAVYRALRVHREGRYLEGHEGYVHLARYLSDGRRLLTADESGIAILWDVEAGVALRGLDSHGGAVRDAVLGADETYAVTAHADGKVRVWELGGGGGVRLLDVDAASIQAGPGRELVTAGADGRVLGWDLRDGTSRALATTPGPVRLATGARAGDPVVAFVAADGGLHVRALEGDLSWDAPDPAGTPATVPGPADLWARVSSVADRVIVRHASGRWRLLSRSTGGSVGGVEGDGRLLDAAFSADGRRLFLSFGTGGGDAGTVEVREASSGALVGSFAAVRKRLFPSPDGSLLALVDNTQTEVYDVERGVERCRLQGHRYHVRGASWSPDGRRLATVGHDGTARVWEIRRETEREGLVARARAGQRVLAVTDDAEAALVVVGGGGAGRAGPTAFEIVSVATGATVVRAEPTGAEVSEPVLDLGGRWVSWMEGTTWRRLEAVAGARPTSIPLAWPTGAKPPGRVHPSPDGRRVAVRSGDAVLVFDARSGAWTSRFGEDGEYNRPFWHPDGDRLLLAHGARGETALYDVADGRAIRVYRGHTGFVIDAAIDPAGGRGASSAVDSTVRLFDLGTGRLLERTAGLPMAGSVIAFGPGGRLLSYTSNEHFLLDARPGASLAEVASLARLGDGEELRLHPDGKRFWIRDAEYRIRLFELDAAAEGARAMARPVLPQDRVLFDRGRALAEGSLSAPFLARDDPGWAVLRAALLLADGRPEEAFLAAGRAREARPGWARPAYLRARAACALAARAPEGSAERAARFAEAMVELEAAAKAGFPDRPLAAGSPPMPEFQPFLGDPRLRELLAALGADLGD